MDARWSSTWWTVTFDGFFLFRAPNRFLRPPSPMTPTRPVTTSHPRPPRRRFGTRRHDWPGTMRMHAKPLPPLTREQQATVEANIGLAYHLADKCRHPTLSRCDLRQEAIVGLARGVVEYDPGRGSLSTIATFHIRSAISRLFKRERRHLGHESVDARVGAVGHNPREARRVRWPVCHGWWRRGKARRGCAPWPRSRASLTAT